MKHIKEILIDYGTLNGPMVQPGKYTVRLTADGKTYTQPFVVVNDPRTSATQADLQAQAAAWFRLRDSARFHRHIGQAHRDDGEAARSTSGAGEEGVRTRRAYRPPLKPLRAKLEAIRGSSSRSIRTPMRSRCTTR